MIVTANLHSQQILNFLLQTAHNIIRFWTQILYSLNYKHL